MAEVCRKTVLDHVAACAVDTEHAAAAKSPRRVRIMNASRLAAAETPESFTRPCVLLVDDNQAILTCAAGVLNTSCTVIGTETDGRAAIAAAVVLQPDVIVLDISMPGMNEFEVAAAMRQAIA